MHTIVVAHNGWTPSEANDLLSKDPLEKMMRANPWTSGRLCALGTPWERFEKLAQFHGWTPTANAVYSHRVAGAQGFAWRALYTP